MMDMRILPLVLAALLVIISLSFAGCTSSTTVPGPAETEQVAGQLAASITSGLNDLKTGIANNSRSLAATGLTGPEAEAVLAQNLLSFPWAYSSLVITPEGIVVTAVPKNYAGVVGEDLSWQPEVQKANTDRAPLISGVFSMAEGFTGISQSYPVFSASGEYLGYTDITYAPETFLAHHIDPVICGTGYDAWVAQTDGTVIYDTTKEEIGKNILSDAAYADPALQEIFRRIIAEPSGRGEYTFFDRNWNRPVTKTAAWDTAGIDGTSWRVVVTMTEDTVTPPGATVVATPAVPIDARYANLTQFVTRAAAYAKEHGKEAALAAFNDVDGSFIDGDMYVFAYEMDGTVIALPYQQALLGTNRAGVTDTNGVEFIRQLIEVAKDGGGSVYYTYPNPGNNYREEFKVSYVLPIDDRWFVGSGIYLPEHPATFPIAERDALASRVKQARNHAQAVGSAPAIRDFNNLSGPYADGARYIFAYGYNGTTLALPFQPELIGTNRLDFADRYGVKIIPWEISAAKNGGGFVYVEYLNPDSGKAEMKLCYVAPVDDTWFVGSGIYSAPL
jgi:hypothetical protein